MTTPLALWAASTVIGGFTVALAAVGETTAAQATAALAALLGICAVVVASTQPERGEKA